jgi:hypothetical protein
MVALIFQPQLHQIYWAGPGFVCFAFVHMVTMYRDSTLAGETLIILFAKMLKISKKKKRNFKEEKLSRKIKNLLGGLGIFSFWAWNLQNEIIILNKPVLKLPLYFPCVANP